MSKKEKKVKKTIGGQLPPNDDEKTTDTIGGELPPDDDEQ